MYEQKKFSILSFVVFLSIVFSLVFPAAALADDGTPPPPAADSSSAKTSSPDPSSNAEGPAVAASADAAPTDPSPNDIAPANAVSTDAAPTDDLSSSTDVVPTDSAPTDVPLEPTADVVAALNDAGVVLLDENGNSVPLASQQAANALVNSDPYFDDGAGHIVGYSSSGSCAAAVTPGHCITSATPLQDAITASPTGVTIFVDQGTYNEDVTIAKQIILTGLGLGATAKSFTLNSGADTTGSSNIFAPVVNVMAGAKIQNGIDLVAPGGTVNVHPGNYNEKATNRAVLGSGSYQFGLFVDKNGVTVQGVDNSGVALTDHNSALLPYVTTNATNNFGYSGIFVQGDNVTLSGLKIGPNAPSDNKTIEVIGDNFSLLNSNLAIPGGGSLYLDDWRYDSGTNTSHIQGYHVQGNLFDSGTSMDISSGAGFSGPVSGRVITGNVFNNSYYWPSVSFNGSNTGVPWFVDSVGGAVISGNTFNNTYHTPDNTSGYIRARGTYDNSQFDWASYWNSNVFTNGAVIDTTDGSAAHLQTYSYPGSYGTINNVRRIGTSIQGEVNHAQPGNTVLVAPGTYAENIIISTPMTLRSISGPGSTFIDSSITGNPYVVFISANDVTLDGFDISSPGYTDAADASGVVVEPPYGPNAQIRITNNIIHDIGTPGRTKVAFGNVGINIGAAQGVEIDHNLIFNIIHSDPAAWANGISIWGGDSDTPSGNIIIHDNLFHDISSPYPADADISTQTDVGSVTVYNNSLISTLAHPTEFGVEVRDTNTVMAENNWWGNATGPYDNSGGIDACGLTINNPTGSGNPVSTCVIYDPWLTKDPSAAGGTWGGSGGNDQGHAAAPIVTPLIPVTGGQPTTLSCSNPSVAMLIGDIQVTFTGLCGYDVVLNSVAKEDLPGDLGPSNSFDDGLSITLLKNGKEIKTLPADASIQVSYPKPTSGNPSVLVWSGSTWNDQTSFVDGNNIISKLLAPATLVLVTH